MGTIHSSKKRNGQLAWYVFYVDAKGVRRHRAAKNARTKEQAKQFLRECEDQAFRRARGADDIKTEIAQVISAYREHIEKQVKHNAISSHSATRYAPEITLFEEYCQDNGIVYVHDLTQTAWDNFQEWLRENGNTKSDGKGFAPKTINHICNTATAILNHGVKKEICSRPPARATRLPLAERKPRYLEREDIQKFLDNSPQELIPLWKWYLYTGMRREEIIMQETKDIQRGLNIIKVSTSKTERGRKRSIPISPALRDVIATQDLSHKYVFPFLHEYSINWTLREIEKICRKAEIEPFTPHVFRHTFAVWALAGGIPLLEVSAMLGHTDIKTTMIYAHIAPESQQVNIQKLKY